MAKAALLLSACGMARRTLSRKEHIGLAGDKMRVHLSKQTISILLTLSLLIAVFGVFASPTPVLGADEYLQVSSSADDAHEAGNGALDTTRTTLRVYSHPNQGSSGYYLSGLRFQSLNVPQGATINSASLSVNVFSNDYDDANMVIYGNNVDDALNFLDDPDIIDTRIRTTANVNWIQGAVETGWHSAPDLSLIIQEIVNRPGWVAGNDLVLLLISNTDVNNLLIISSYDGDPSLAARLHIDYTAAPDKTITVPFKKIWNAISVLQVQIKEVVSDLDQLIGDIDSIVQGKVDEAIAVLSIDWSQITGIPSDLADGDDVGIAIETDPTVVASVKDGVDWTELSNIPADIADGDQVGIATEVDPTVLASVKDGVSWGEISGIPAGFADDVDDVGGAGTAPALNPLQVALLRWYEASEAGNFFSVGDGPRGICFDGANIWVANHSDDTVTKLKASDGSTVGTYSVGNIPWDICFDGANIWVTNLLGDNVTKL